MLAEDIQFSSPSKARKSLCNLRKVKQGNPIFMLPHWQWSQTLPLLSICDFISPTELYIIFSSPLHFLRFFCTSIFCSKEIASFHRPKAKWYPHENNVAAQLHGTAVSHGQMTAIVMTLGGKGIKLMVNADETPVSVKLNISNKLG